MKVLIDRVVGTPTASNEPARGRKRSMASLETSSPQLEKSLIDNALVRRYLTYMRTSISSKGQIVLPAEFRVQDRIEAGQQFEVERLQEGEYVLKRLPAPGKPGLLRWLQSCP